MFSPGSSATETLPFRDPVFEGEARFVDGYGSGTDPYALPLSSLLDVKKASQDLRRGFVRKVYGLLAMQLLLTTVIAVPFQFMDSQALVSNAWLAWFSGPSLMLLLCALACSPELARSYPANEICLFLLTAFQGVLVGYFSAAFTWQSVILAVGITVVVVIGLTIYGVFTSTDFTGSGSYIFGALLTFVAFALALAVMAACGIHIQWLVVLGDLMCVLLFVMITVYDTQMILGSHGGHKQEFSLDDYVAAALSLYLDIVNLMMGILSLTGSRDSG